MRVEYDIRRISGANYVVAVPDELELDDTAVRVLHRDKPPFLMDLSLMEINDSVQLRYLMTGGISMANIGLVLQKSEFIRLLKHLLEALVSSADWFLDYHNFCLNPAYIFVEREDSAVHMVYLPVVQEYLTDARICDFFRDLIGDSKISGDSGRMQIELLQYVKSSTFSLSGLLDMVLKYDADAVNPGGSFAQGNSGIPDKPPVRETPQANAAPPVFQMPPVQNGSQANAAPPAFQTPPVQNDPQVNAAPPVFQMPSKKKEKKQEKKKPEVLFGDPAGDFRTEGEQKLDWLDRLDSNSGKSGHKKEKPAKEPKKGSSGGFLGGIFGGKKEEKNTGRSISFAGDPVIRPMDGPVNPGAPAAQDMNQPYGAMQGAGSHYAIPGSYMNAGAGNADDTDIEGSEGGAPHLQLCSAAMTQPPQTIELNMGPYGMSIGRRNAKGIMSDFMFPETEKGVSKQHARIYIQDGNYYLTDLDSSDGTWLNGESCIPNKSYRLSQGDQIMFSKKYKLVYRVMI